MTDRSGADADSARLGDEPEPEPARHGRSFLGELPILLLVALGLALLLKAFVVQAFYIPSGSMEPTLQVGDRVLVNKMIYRFRDIERGEIVVFNGVDSFAPEIQVNEPSNPVARVARSVAAAIGFAPPSERDFIKRVVGIPGDRVICCDAQNRITVNGVPLEESAYLFPGNRPSEQPFDIQVPDGRIFVLGDHRARSSDSRAHLDLASGTVETDKVIGRAFVVVWPVNRFGRLGVPETFDRTPLGALSPGPGALAVGVVASVAWWRQRRRA
jgi:signal peptidase I